MRWNLKLLFWSIAVEAICCLALGQSMARGDEGLYSAEFADGSRIVAGKLTDWGVIDHPRLDGRSLHDPANPVRWLRRDSAGQPAAPDAFLEMIGGDVLPGRVVAAGASTTVEEGDIGAHLLVEPTTPISRPDGLPRGTVRILTRWLRRVVWQRRPHDAFQPATLFFKDGRQLAFRSIRFRGDGLSVLTDDGRRDARFADLVELDMPSSDWWNAYFEQVALLTPDCRQRLVRYTTVDGLRATVSPDRFLVLPWGNPNDQDFWFQAIQPAWSLDPFFLKHTRIVLRQYFGPQQVPLSMIEPARTLLRSALAVGWPPKIDRNVQGSKLTSGSNDYAWGIGTQAYTEMEFPMPSCAASFHSRVGLDRVVGRGGCARAIVYADHPNGQPLFQSDHLIGSSNVVDTGILPLNPAAPDSRLVIVSHPDSADRPQGADPLDIRDVVDWLEPEVNLDLEKLRAEVRSRAERIVPGLDGWKISQDGGAGGETGPVAFASRWDDATQAFEFEFRPTAAAATLTRSIAIGPDQNWLLLYVNRNQAERITSPTHATVRINGQPVDQFEVPARWQADPPPQQLAVEKYHDQTINLEVRLEPRDDKSFVDWRSMIVVNRLPTLFEVFEDEVQPPIALTAAAGDAAVVTSDHYSGAASIKVSGESGKDGVGQLSNLNLPIRENPRFGEYRYLRFAWRKVGGGQIGLDLDFLQADNGQKHDADRWQRVDALRRLAAAAAEERQLASVIQMFDAHPIATPEGAIASSGMRRQLAQIKRVESSLKSELDEMSQAVEAGAAGGTPLHLRYFAGEANAAPPGADIRSVKLAEREPDQWLIVTCDLARDCGNGQLRSISLVSRGGEALLDHVYLARTPQDFDRIGK